jgi:16S rRNA (guanine1516-N2)-methyltransferase
MKPLSSVAFQLLDHPQPAPLLALAQALLWTLNPPISQDFAVVVRADANGVSVRATADSSALPTRVDLLDPGLLYRIRTSGKRQGLGKAIGLDKVRAGHVLQVVDATAGLGKDAMVLAALGCEVTMLERSPLLHALLLDGLQRARIAADSTWQPVLARLQLQEAEARSWLPAQAAPDVVYIDPMFPARDNAAKSKKDIALLHHLLGEETDLLSLLAVARATAKYRVVLKRPDGKLAQQLPEPTLIVAGKAASFAVYVNNSFSKMR